MRRIIKYGNDGVTMATRAKKTAKKTVKSRKSTKSSNVTVKTKSKKKAVIGSGTAKRRTAGKRTVEGSKSRPKKAKKTATKKTVRTKTKKLVSTKKSPNKVRPHPMFGKVCTC